MASRKPLVLGATGRPAEIADVDVLLAAAATITTLASTGYHSQSAATGLTAAGTTQATALALAKQVNVVTTVAAGSGVILAALTFVAGLCVEIIIINAGANALLAYPPSGATINALAVNVAFSVAAGAIARFYQISGTAWRAA